jgi:hypothetical protein
MKFMATAGVTISITREIEARTAAEALQTARRLAMPDLCRQCSSNQDDEEEPPATWTIDQIDGEAIGIQIERVRGGR